MAMKKIFKILIYIFAAIGFILVIAYVAVELGLTKTSGIIDKQHDYFKDQPAVWQQGDEWATLKVAISNDEASITEAAADSGVKSRVIASLLVTEQLRLFYSNRELFKTVFAPLKILAVQSQFSWGVMGVKQDTAKEIESNLQDSTSPFYIGPQYEHLLDFSTSDHDAERFNKLTDEHDRYYSYLYAGLYVKEIESQWQKAGFPIDDKPDVIATLYDIGFNNSRPHANPQSGGAEIDIASTTYSFGDLADDFYQSDQLTDVFPK